jgi:hypothetical protein
MILASDVPDRPPVAVTDRDRVPGSVSPHLGYPVEDTLRGFHETAVRSIGAFFDWAPTF